MKANNITQSFKVLTASFAVFVGLSASWSEVVQGYFTETETEDVIEESTKATSGAVIEHVVSTVNTHVRKLGGGVGGAFNIRKAEGYALGLSAGDSSAGYAIWYTPSYSDFENNGAVKVGGDYDGTLTTHLFGVDAVLNSDMVFGATLGYETNDTKFDNNSKSDADGYIFALYGAYNVSSAATLYLNAGMINQDNDLDDYSTGALATGDFDSDTLFANIGVMRTMDLGDDTYLTMDGSYSYADTESDSYTDSLSRRIDSSKSYISEFYVNSELAKGASWGEYFGTVGVRFDLTSDSEYDNGDIGVDLGMGVRFNPTDNITGDVAIKKLFLQKDEENVTISANIRYEF